jgi:hypothetical protein
MNEDDLLHCVLQYLPADLLGYFSILPAFMLCRLNPESRALIHGYGSDAIHKVRFRENFAMVGQKGLSRGTAIEQVRERNV